MLVGERKEAPQHIAIVADSREADLLSIEIAGMVRRAGIAASIFNMSNPRKRFDRAVDDGAIAILALTNAVGAPEDQFGIRWVPKDIMGTFNLKQKIERIIEQRFNFRTPNKLIVGWADIIRSSESQ